MKALLLTHNIDDAKEWVLNQGIENIFTIDERDIAEHNPIKFKYGFLDIFYSNNIVEYMKFMRNSYKASRPMVMLMDMRHHTAIDKIPHDFSILYYDDSMKKRLAYHPKYKTTYKLSDPSYKLLQELLQKSV